MAEKIMLILDLKTDMGCSVCFMGTYSCGRI